jgi:hypothetical protein
MARAPHYGPGRKLDLSKPGAFRKLKEKQSEDRRRFRRALEAQGWPADEIDARIAAVQRRHQAERDELRATVVAEAEAQAQREAETYARLSPSDSRYRPAPVDPLLRGPARVSSMTARAAARRKAVTRYEHSRFDAEEAS